MKSYNNNNSQTIRYIEKQNNAFDKEYLFMIS